MLVVKEEVSESGETEEITVKEELYEANKNYVINEKPEEICKPKSRLLESSINTKNGYGNSVQKEIPITGIKIESNDDDEVGRKSDILAVSCDPKLDSQERSICDIVEKDPLKVENVCEPKLETNESILLENPFHSKIDFCPRIKVEKDTVVMNVDTVHEEKKPFFQCDQCDKQFSYKNHLKRHISSVHDGKKFDCDQCDKQFSGK